MDHVLIIGCGDIGRRVGARWRARGASVSGLVRGEASAALAEAAGISVLRADLDVPEQLPALRVGNALVYYFAPPPRQGVQDMRLRGFLGSLDPGALPARLIYISTTGVYGDCGGAWVDESRPVAPGTDRARRRVDAEQALREWGEVAGVATVILRVPGIYGPGRLPRARLERAEPVLAAGESPWTNRIHADDLAEVCVAAAERGRPGAVYNVSDGRPGTMSDYLNRVADALGMPRPPVISRAAAAGRLSPGMLSYLAESRRIDNRRMCEELGVSLRYPDLDAGLADCVEMRRADTR